MKKSITFVLAIILTFSCFLLPASAFNQPNDKIVSAADEVARAPEYIRIKGTSGYNCYTTYGTTAAEGATVACQVRSGDYLLFLTGNYDGLGRWWVKGQIQGSHSSCGWYVWLLYDSNYMSIGY